MIVLFTDFGMNGPYVGQMKARLFEGAPSVPVIDLLHSVPPFDAMGASYLLAAYAPAFPENSVFVAVVDPGVGGDRRALVVDAGGQWFVGPDNGLFEMIIRRAERAGCDQPRVWAITWRPESLSASFHGRDLFAPVAARIATNQSPDKDISWYAPLSLGEIRTPEWPDGLDRVIFIDDFGNAVTGLWAEALSDTLELGIGGPTPGDPVRILPPARTFCEVEKGDAFWYENANGLVEIAVSRGRADRDLGLVPGSQVSVTNL